MAEHGCRTALIVGVGSGVSASLARLFNKAGIKVALAARRAANLADLAKETGAMALACDATDRSQVTKLFAQLDEGFGAPDVVVYNASYRARGPFVTLDPDGVGELVRMAAERGRKTRADIKLGICGEHGGDPASIHFCASVGLNYVSCSPYRVPIAKLAAAQAALSGEGDGRKGEG